MSKNVGLSESRTDGGNWARRPSVDEGMNMYRLSTV